jgi:hypothetical protein
MTQKFLFSGKAEILHLNARKEGPDDDKQLAVDVKLRAVTTMAVLHYFDDMLGQLFYTDIGAVRNTMIGPIPMKHELEDYRLEVMGGTHHGVKLKKFALEAMDDGMVSITFQASFKPSGDEVAQMAEYLQDEIDIYLEPANAELDLGEAAGLNKSLAADGATATLHNANGDLLATFGEGADPLYENAKLVVVSHRRASISLVQRELRIGYNRAARLIEQMEADGVVSAMDGSGSRDVLVAAAEAA